MASLFWANKRSISLSKFAVAVLCGVSVPAVAQGIPSDMKPLLDRKYSIQEQQAETERVRTETERRRIESQIQAERQASVGGTPYRAGTVIGGVDALAGTSAPAYQLENGVVIRFSGIYWPSSQSRCIANCPDRN